MSTAEQDDGPSRTLREHEEMHQPIAGPSHSPTQIQSRIPPPSNPVERPGPSRPTRQPGLATHRHLPKTAYGSIEYPGPVSRAAAITDLTSQEDIDTCFNTSSGSNSLLEIHYRKDKMGAPVRGYRVASQKLLVKVVKRKRKDGEGGVFTTEVVGPVNHTVRFRSMADFHYTPNPDGPTQQLLTTLKNLDYDTILDYQFPEFNETFTTPASPSAHPERSHHSLLDLQPLPQFSDRRLPLVYNFKLSQATALTDHQDPITGEVRQRYYNTARHIGFSPIVVGHMNAGIPMEPEAKVRQRMPKLNQAILEKMKALFEERPVWMRQGLLAQFTPEEAKIVVDAKSYIPACAYMFGAGPYWKCLARLGYDPRENPESRIYQRTYFYIQVARNKQPVFATPEPGEEEDEPVIDKSSHEAWGAEQRRLIEEGKRPEFDHSRDHIFDGQILNRDKPDYQLCDIEDTLLKRYINDERLITDHCDARTGWYKPAAYDVLREMIKTKYVYVRDNNEPAPDSTCYDLMQSIEDSVVVSEDAQAEDGRNQDHEGSGVTVDGAGDVDMS